jgi:hypothetical protein
MPLAIYGLAEKDGIRSLLLPPVQHLKRGGIMGLRHSGQVNKIERKTALLLMVQGTWESRCFDAEIATFPKGPCFQLQKTRKR